MDTARVHRLEHGSRAVAPSAMGASRDFADKTDRSTVFRPSQELMGHVYDEFERTLEAWRVKYAGQPRREILRLCLIALEREELVTIAYREALILQRLAAMPIAQDVRTLIHHALVWAWKDEEMHAIYIRGAIFRLGSTPLRLRAYARQMAGAIGGWQRGTRLV